MMSPRIFWILLFLTGIPSFCSAIAQEKDSLNPFQNAAQRLLQAPATKGATVSWCFRDVESGQIIASHQAESYLLPASTAKLFTTSVALKTLGHDFRFNTWILKQGKLKDGVLTGNLIISGGGDPSLGSGKAGAQSAKRVLESIVTLLKENGIRKIKGDLIVDPHFFRYDHTAVPRDWPWEDLGNYYGAGVYGLNWRENSFNITFKNGDSAGAISPIMSIEPKLYGTEVINYVKTGSVGEEIYLFAAPLSKEIRADGCLKRNSGTVTERGALTDPPRQFLGELSDYLKHHEIRITGEAIVLMESSGIPEKRDTLGTLESPVLHALVEETNFNSNNLFAEALAKMIGKKWEAGTRAEDGAETIVSFMRNPMLLVDSGMLLRDGSGLSRTNHVSTSFQSNFLRTIARQTDFPAFYITLPEAGKSGTMRSFEAIKNLRAKSGSIGGVRGYVGYLNDTTGRLIAFSLLLNNFSGSSSEIKNLCAGLLREASLGHLPPVFRFYPFKSLSDTLYQLPEIRWFDKTLREDPLWNDLNPEDQKGLTLRLYLSGEPTVENPYKIAVFRSAKDPWNNRFLFRIHVITRRIERWDAASQTYVLTGLPPLQKPADREKKDKRKRK